MNDLRIVNLSSYTSPEIVEKSNKQWVAYGSDNNFFGHLISNYENSPTNNAIINGISQMIYGKGLDALDSNKKPEAYAKMITLFHKDCVRKLCYDLKLMGQCAIQVIYSKDRKTIAQVEHIPVENLRAEKCNEKGDIAGYYYSDDWSKVKQRTELQRIPAFGFSKENIEIIYVKPYRAGYKYYSSPDYTGCLQWCEIESEVSNFHLNNTANSFSPNTFIQFNNGTPPAEERQMLENRIADKFQGTGGSKFILAFNDNPDSAATVETLQVSDAHNTYQYVSEEATKKIMVGHRVVSPLLLGIKDNTGLGNNAEELSTATVLMENTVILPFRHLLIDAFDSILAYNNIALKLYFKTLQPLEFTDLENVEDEETKEEETGVKLNKVCCSSDELTDELGDILFDGLDGEIMSEEWEVAAERDHSEDNEGLEDWAQNFIDKKETFNIAASPNRFSYLDKSTYKVRYKYAIGSRKKYKEGSRSRLFCTNMMAASRAGVVYRIEDIDRASRNLNFKAAELPMHNGQKFDLFKHKGGIYCRHIFKEVLYKLKVGKEISTDIADYKKTKDIPKSYKPTPRGSKESKIAPINTPTKGAYS